MNPRVARLAIAGLVLVVGAAFLFVAIDGDRGMPAANAGAAAGPAVAPVDRRVPAPELVRPAGFLNTAPVTLAGLRGKVVLLDFWTYTCINCQRTFPFLRAWHDRYAGDGLVVLGVHSPEFDFEKDPANVAASVQTYGVTWPVVLDPEMETWNAYGNRYWPAEYLIDREGRVARIHYGEGEYPDTEAAIRALLAEDGGTVSGGSPVTEPPPPEREGQTPETYAGYVRGNLANPDGYVRDDVYSYELPASPPAHGFALGGAWKATAEGITAAGPGAVLVLPFTARLVHVVAAGPASAAGAGPT